MRCHLSGGRVEEKGQSRLLALAPSPSPSHASFKPSIQDASRCPVPTVPTPTVPTVPTVPRLEAARLEVERLPDFPTPRHGRRAASPTWTCRNTLEPRTPVAGGRK